MWIFHGNVTECGYDGESSARAVERQALQLERWRDQLVVSPGNELSIDSCCNFLSGLETMDTMSVNRLVAVLLSMSLVVFMTLRKGGLV